jgi:hypothetical protein
VACLSILLGEQRLRVAQALPETATLVRELESLDCSQLTLEESSDPVALQQPSKRIVIFESSSGSYENAPSSAASTRPSSIKVPEA